MSGQYPTPPPPYQERDPGMNTPLGPVRRPSPGAPNKNPAVPIGTISPYPQMGESVSRPSATNAPYPETVNMVNPMPIGNKTGYVNVASAVTANQANRYNNPFGSSPTYNKPSPPMQRNSPSPRMGRYSPSPRNNYPYPSNYPEQYNSPQQYPPPRASYPYPSTGFGAYPEYSSGPSNIPVVPNVPIPRVPYMGTGASSYTNYPTPYNSYNSSPYYSGYPVSSGCHSYRKKCRKSSSSSSSSSDCHHHC